MNTLLSPRISFNAAQAAMVSAEASQDFSCRKAATLLLLLKMFATVSACAVGIGSGETKLEMRGFMATTARVDGLE